ncbi:MAG: polysaccharide pyruvyl transferase family protein [Bacteroidales bacterium]|jgi:polysaccharide pyruvyl transferase WcaK-like protein|nr:polysaccharide pyruvyl transferase family protein [Bacteroidales bacterium]
MDRRQFIRQTGSLAISTVLFSQISCSTGKKAPTILVVSGWQDVNIGDIAHTPGLLHILENAFSDAKIILWKRSKSEKVEVLLKKNFPAIDIIYGNVDKEYNVDSEEVKKAVESADIFIHGSGPSVVAASNLEFWAKHTDKPFGIYGTTIEHISEKLAALLKKASFIFTRETASIEKLRQAGITGQHIMFAPDATFYLDIWDDEKALAFMKKNGLEEGKFICVIPRLRKTPYWEIRKTSQTEEEIRKITELNNKWKEIDHAKARMAIVAWVRETGMKVVLCPEMTYEVGLFDELLYNPLPDDVKPFVVKHDYWLPDEAMSLYARMHTLLSFECHSPIMAIRCGKPTFYLRQPQDTIKGQMYYDLGLSDWVFEIEETTGEQITGRLMEVYGNYDGALKKVSDTMEKVENCYVKANKIVKEVISSR